MDRPETSLLPMSVESHIAVQTVELRHIKETVERIEQSQSGHVSRPEWEQRNGYVDGVFTQVHTKIQSVEDEMKAQRAPWWVIIGAGLGGVSAVIALITLVAK